jgi:hypothetical protein
MAQITYGDRPMTRPEITIGTAAYPIITIYRVEYTPDSGWEDMPPMRIMGIPDGAYDIKYRVHDDPDGPCAPSDEAIADYIADAYDRGGHGSLMHGDIAVKRVHIER